MTSVAGTESETTNVASGVDPFQSEKRYGVQDTETFFFEGRWSSHAHVLVAI